MLAGVASDENVTRAKHTLHATQSVHTLSFVMSGATRKRSRCDGSAMELEMLLQRARGSGAMIQHCHRSNLRKSRAQQPGVHRARKAQRVPRARRWVGRQPCKPHAVAMTGCGRAHPTAARAAGRGTCGEGGGAQRPGAELGERLVLRPVGGAGGQRQVPLQQPQLQHGRRPREGAAGAAAAFAGVLHSPQNILLAAER